MTQLLRSPDRAAGRPVLDLRPHAARVAVTDGRNEVTYAELDERAAHYAHEVLGPTRRLVMVEGANDLDTLVAYLAALQHGHTVLLVPGDRAAQVDGLVASYDPDVVVRGGSGGVEQRREGSRHDLHPELALLLSTSGSTGSPRLVRLSRTNVTSNAAAIATSLGLDSEDRAITSLPMHYCYGLSVVHSHLLVGAGLVLTDGSVVDACFWDLFRAAGATSLAGVPHTFDLLDRSGFADRSLPSLRRVTQAGGRLAPDRVRHYAALGRERGWDLVVMYGQTEATARMAYLPPALASDRPESVGVAVPGGTLRIDPVPECAEPGTGELVYTGPNVMMGYADRPGDLGRGPELTELRTGDLARVRDGLHEIVGRRNRQAKLFGLRLDLDRVEREASRVAPVRCATTERALHAFTDRPRSAESLRAAVAAAAGVPAPVVRVSLLAELPLTASGKPDHAALARHARLVEEADEATSAEEPPTSRATTGVVTAGSLRDEFAAVLGRPDATTQSTFVGLGGDSLSYVELATRLGRRLESLPSDWHRRTVAELAAPVRRRRGSPVDTSVLLRVLAIVAIVGTHANLLTVVGGAHVLLAVAGFNFARFQLAETPRAVRLRHGLTSVAQVVVPSTLFIGALAATTGFYDPVTAVFLNGLLGPDTWTVDWQFWFLEALVWCSLAALGLMAVPAVDRVERRAPYAFAMGLLAIVLLLRFALVGIDAGPTERYATAVVAWCFVAGWAAARAATPARRLAVVAATAVGVLGLFGDLQRELVVLGGVAVLALLPSVRVPRRLVAPLGVLASSSLFVYLTHWQVYPHLEVDHPLLATLASFAVGIAAWALARPGLRALGRALRGGTAADR